MTEMKMMDKEFEDRMEKARGDEAEGVSYSFHVRPDELAGFMERLGKYAGGHLSTGLRMKWDGFICHVQILFNRGGS